MPSYRFCRPDDIPYLVRAVNECFNVHFPTVPPMTVERFREEMKTLDLWPSNCMVASSNSGPIAVMIGTKRAQEVLILRIGVHPDHQRQGHGGHLLTSLSQKLAVLGPERLVAEIPRALVGIEQFFAATDYRREDVLTDWLRPPIPTEPVPTEWIIPITVEELVEQELFKHLSETAWQRSSETLVNRRDELKGWAVASPERVEAFVLWDETGSGEVEILGLYGQPGARRELFLGLLIRHLASTTEKALRLARLADQEHDVSWLEGLGFQRGEESVRYSATATPA